LPDRPISTCTAMILAAIFAVLAEVVLALEQAGDNEPDE
jgi:hypothetical protein